MGLSNEQTKKIIHLLENTIDSKLRKYARESSLMPFLAGLIQDNERVAAYSFLHSIATTLGMSIYEQVSKIIAEEHSETCYTSYDIGGVISTDQKSVIDRILRELRNGERKSNINIEIEEVLSANPEGGKSKKEGRKADFYMFRSGVEHYVEIKTAKPNIDIFAKSKEKLLEWVARRRKPIRVILAFPYNPYYPQPYERFTLQGLLTPGEDFLIGESYWEFLCGENIFEELLSLFNTVGRSYKQRIADKIKEVASIKMDMKSPS